MWKWGRNNIGSVLGMKVYLVHGTVAIAFGGICHFINMLCEQVLAAEGLKCRFPGNCRALGSIQTEFCIPFWPRIQTVGFRKMQPSNTSY